MSRILIIEDETPMRTALADVLEAEGYRTLGAADGEAGLRKALDEKPDLILLDIMMPKLDGFAVCAELRRLSNPVPVLMLTAKGQVEDRVTGLDAGADDYLVKPFSTGELVARMRVAIRHHAPQDAPEKFVSGRLTVDLQDRRVTVAGEPVKLTPTEYGLLRLFVQHAGRILTHRHILREVWGPNANEETNYLRVYVTALRKKLEANPQMPELLITEPGVGYRLRHLPP
jgi:two-component system KDP operon response regulator KdpE